MSKRVSGVHKSIVHTDIENIPVIPGFFFAGVAAGIKKTGALDLGLIAHVDAKGQRQPTSSFAAIFTQNKVRAAPVKIAQRNAKSKKVTAVLVNSGNANACTGSAGATAAQTSIATLARAMSSKPSEVLPASTGVIGQLLPIARIVAAIPSLLKAGGADRAREFTRAIMTTDQWPKVAWTEVRVGKVVLGRVLGMAKGAGMIHPNMATTLGFVVTDIYVPRALFQKTLQAAADQTFNAISVDGDTSTNDSLIALGSEFSRTRIGPRDEEMVAAFSAALTAILDSLSTSIVRDGEGAEHVVRFDIEGLTSDRDAKKIAATIATSPLVKTALHGVDANWGRILAAAGRSGVSFDGDKAQMDIAGVTVVRNGVAVGGDAEARAQELMKAPSYSVRLKLGKGKGRAHYTTCDFGKSYIAVNANYRS